MQDLDASVRTKTWATQLNHEAKLNDAFDNTSSVYLIFSANKSGEYFGYARMASKIDGEPITITEGAVSDSATDTGIVPTSNETPPTATAPRGWIYNDSARGTIFWESGKADTDTAQQKQEEEEELERSGRWQQWSKQFSIEWVSTARLSFYLTRGLRNPWNANREVKIARDCTELEPRIGRLLIQMFHRGRPTAW